MPKNFLDLTDRHRVVICGCRTFNNYDLLREKMDYYTFRFENPVIISGGNKRWDPATGKWVGADFLGEKWAHFHKYLVQVFHPDWEKYGKKAGPIRNRQMAIHAAGGKGSGYCVAFWDGVSKGTKSMIEFAKFYDLKVKVVEY